MAKGEERNGALKKQKQKQNHLARSCTVEKNVVRVYIVHVVFTRMGEQLIQSAIFLCLRAG